MSTQSWKNSIYRSVAFFLAFHLSLFNSLSYASPNASYIKEEPTVQKFQSLNVQEMKLPESLGSIQDRFEGASGQSVILIQDAHAIPNAQKNIQNLIDHFQKQYGIKLIGLEGAAAQLDAQIFKSFPDKKKLLNVLQEYQKNGELSAGTAAAILNESESIYQGVEDWALYERGIRLYLAAMAAEERIQAQINQEKEQLTQEKAKVYSPELLSVDRLLNDFYANKVNLLEVLTKLAAIKAPAQGSALQLIWQEVQNQNGGANLEVEVRKIAEQVRLSLKDARRFNQQYQDFQTGRISPQAFAVFMQELTTEQNIPIQISPTLLVSMNDQKRMEQLQGTALFREFEIYAQSVMASLLRSEQAELLNQKTQELNLMEKFSRLELSREEWEIVKNSPSLVTPNFSAHLAFYQNAESRDETLFKNLMKLGQSSSLRAPQGRSNLIMIAGGFHAHGLTQKLKAQGISYALIMPNIESLPEHILYQEHMRGEVSWKEYLKPEAGRIPLYKAFVRGTRDRLLDSQDPYFLKAWRDQIILDLAAQNRIEQASRYIKYLDELNPALQELDSGLDKTLRTRWMTNVDNFISGLKQLEATNAFTKENILNLLKPAAVPDAYTSAGVLTESASLSLAPIRIDSIPFDSTPSTDLQRSELRDYDAVVMDGKNEKSVTFHGKWLPHLKITVTHIGRNQFTYQVNDRTAASVTSSNGKIYFWLGFTETGISSESLRIEFWHKNADALDFIKDDPSVRLTIDSSNDYTDQGESLEDMFYAIGDIDRGWIAGFDQRYIELQKLIEESQANASLIELTEAFTELSNQLKLKVNAIAQEFDKRRYAAGRETVFSWYSQIRRAAVLLDYYAGALRSAIQSKKAEPTSRSEMRIYNRTLNIGHTLKLHTGDRTFEMKVVNIWGNSAELMVSDNSVVTPIRPEWVKEGNIVQLPFNQEFGFTFFPNTYFRITSDRGNATRLKFQVNAPQAVRIEHIKSPRSEMRARGWAQGADEGQIPEGAKRARFMLGNRVVTLAAYENQLYVMDETTGDRNQFSKQLFLGDGAEITIGKSRSGNALRISGDDYVSRKHLRIRFKDNAWSFHDNSKNGTYYYTSVINKQTTDLEPTPYLMFVKYTRKDGWITFHSADSTPQQKPEPKKRPLWQFWRSPISLRAFLVTFTLISLGMGIFITSVQDKPSLAPQERLARLKLRQSILGWIPYFDESKLANELYYLDIFEQNKSKIIQGIQQELAAMGISGDIKNLSVVSTKNLDDRTDFLLQMEINSQPYYVQLSNYELTGREPLKLHKTSSPFYYRAIPDTILHNVEGTALLINLGTEAVMPEIRYFDIDFELMFRPTQSIYNIVFLTKDKEEAYQKFPLLTAAQVTQGSAYKITPIQSEYRMMNAYLIGELQKAAEQIKNDSEIPAEVKKVYQEDIQKAIKTLEEASSGVNSVRSELRNDADAKPTQKRKWWQFTLVKMLLVTAMIAGGFGFLSQDYSFLPFWMRKTRVRIMEFFSRDESKARDQISIDMALYDLRTQNVISEGEEPISAPKFLARNPVNFLHLDFERLDVLYQEFTEVPRHVVIPTHVEKVEVNQVGSNFTSTNVTLSDGQTLKFDPNLAPLQDGDNARSELRAVISGKENLGAAISQAIETRKSQLSILNPGREVKINDYPMVFLSIDGKRVWQDRAINRPTIGKDIVAHDTVIPLIPNSTNFIVSVEEVIGGSTANDTALTVTGWKIDLNTDSIMDTEALPDAPRSEMRHMVHARKIGESVKIEEGEKQFILTVEGKKESPRGEVIILSISPNANIMPQRIVQNDSERPDQTILEVPLNSAFTLKDLTRTTIRVVEDTSGKSYGFRVLLQMDMPESVRTTRLKHSTKLYLAQRSELRYALRDSNASVETLIEPNSLEAQALTLIATLSAANAQNDYLTQIKKQLRSYIILRSLILQNFAEREKVESDYQKAVFTWRIENIFHYFHLLRQSLMSRAQNYLLEHEESENAVTLHKLITEIIADDTVERAYNRAYDDAVSEDDAPNRSEMRAKQTDILADIRDAVAAENWNQVDKTMKFIIDGNLIPMVQLGDKYNPKAAKAIFKLLEQFPPVVLQRKDPSNTELTYAEQITATKVFAVLAEFTDAADEISIAEINDTLGMPGLWLPAVNDRAVVTDFRMHTYVHETFKDYLLELSENTAKTVRALLHENPKLLQQIQAAAAEHRAAINAELAASQQRELEQRAKQQAQIAQDFSGNKALMPIFQAWNQRQSLVTVNPVPLETANQELETYLDGRKGPVSDTLKQEVDEWRGRIKEQQNQNWDAQYLLELEIFQIWYVGQSSEERQFWRQLFGEMHKFPAPEYEIKMVRDQIIKKIGTIPNADAYFPHRGEEDFLNAVYYMIIKVRNGKPTPKGQTTMEVTKKIRAFFGDDSTKIAALVIPALEYVEKFNYQHPPYPLGEPQKSTLKTIRILLEAEGFDIGDKEVWNNLLSDMNVVTTLGFIKQDPPVRSSEERSAGVKSNASSSEPATTRETRDSSKKQLPERAVKHNLVLADVVLTVAVFGDRFFTLYEDEIIQEFGSSRVLTVGRNPQSDIVLDVGRVSGNHLEFKYEGGAWQVRDVGSTNGTWYNDQKLTAKWTPFRSEMRAKDIPKTDGRFRFFLRHMANNDYDTAENVIRILYKELSEAQFPKQANLMALDIIQASNQLAQMLVDLKQNERAEKISTLAYETMLHYPADPKLFRTIEFWLAISEKIARAFIKQEKMEEAQQILDRSTMVLNINSADEGVRNQLKFSVGAYNQLLPLWRKVNDFPRMQQVLKTLRELVEKYRSGPVNAQRIIERSISFVVIAFNSVIEKMLNSGRVEEAQALLPQVEQFYQWYPRNAELAAQTPYFVKLYLKIANAYIVDQKFAEAEASTDRAAELVVNKNLKSLMAEVTEVYRNLAEGYSSANFKRAMVRVTRKKKAIFDHFSPSGATSSRLEMRTEHEINRRQALGWIAGAAATSAAVVALGLRGKRYQSEAPWESFPSMNPHDPNLTHLQEQVLESMDIIYEWIMREGRHSNPELVLQHQKLIHDPTAIKDASDFESPVIFRKYLRPEIQIEMNFRLIAAHLEAIRRVKSQDYFAEFAAMLEREIMGLTALEQFREPYRRRYQIDSRIERLNVLRKQDGMDRNDLTFDDFRKWFEKRPELLEDIPWIVVDHTAFETHEAIVQVRALKRYESLKLYSPRGVENSKQALMDEMNKMNAPHDAIFSQTEQLLISKNQLHALAFLEWANLMILSWNGLNYVEGQLLATLDQNLLTTLKNRNDVPASALAPFYADIIAKKIEESVLFIDDRMPASARLYPNGLQAEDRKIQLENGEVYQIPDFNRSELRVDEPTRVKLATVVASIVRDYTHEQIEAIVLVAVQHPIDVLDSFVPRAPLNTDAVTALSQIREWMRQQDLPTDDVEIWRALLEEIQHQANINADVMAQLRMRQTAGIKQTQMDIPVFKYQVVPETAYKTVIRAGSRAAIKIAIEGDNLYIEIEKQKLAKKFVVKNGEVTEDGKVIANDGIITFGRSASTNHVHVDDERASRKHLIMRHLNGVWQFKDLDSTNSTFWGGVTYRGGDWVTIYTDPVDENRSELRSSAEIPANQIEDGVEPLKMFDAGESRKLIYAAAEKRWLAIFQQLYDRLENPMTLTTLKMSDLAKESSFKVSRLKWASSNFRQVGSLYQRLKKDWLVQALKHYVAQVPAGEELTITNIAKYSNGKVTYQKIWYAINEYKITDAEIGVGVATISIESETRPTTTQPNMNAIAADVAVLLAPEKVRSELRDLQPEQLNYQLLANQLVEYEINVDTFAVALRTETENKIREIAEQNNPISVGKEIVLNRVEYWISLLDKLQNKKFRVAMRMSNQADTMGYQHITEALLQSQENLDQVMIEAQTAVNPAIINKLRENKLHFTLFKSFDRFNRVTLMNQAAVPVIDKSKTFENLNPEFFGVGVYDRDEVSDPMVEVAESVLQVVTAILRADRITDKSQLRSAEALKQIDAELLKDLFAGYSESEIVYFKDGNAYISRSALQRYLVELKNAQVVGTAA